MKIFGLINKLHYYWQSILVFIFSRHGGYLRYLARVTPYVNLRRKAWTLTGIKLGNDVYVNHSITILDGGDNGQITIHDRVALSPNIILITNSSPNDSNLIKEASVSKYIKNGPIEIGSDSWIGAGCVIQPNVTIGKNCIIGSSSNVTKNIPDNSIAYGNPAKVIKGIFDDN